MRSVLPSGGFAVRPRARVLFAAMAFLLLAGAGGAVDTYWLGGSGTVTNTANWSAGSVPGAGDNAIFTNRTPAIFWVSNDLAATLANVVWNGSLTGVTNYLVAVDTLVATNSFVVAQNAGSTNRVTVWRGNFAVTNADGTAQFIVGRSGVSANTLLNSANGNLLMLADGVIVSQNASSSNSTATIGAGSANTAALVTPSLVVGQNAGAIGTFSVGNSGYLFATNAAGGGTAIVGESGKGTLAMVAGAARMVADQIVLGKNAGASGTFTLTAGVLTNGAPGSSGTNLVVGFSGLGAFTQAAGSNLIANLAIVGLNAGATGTVTQTGGGMALTNAGGTGTLVLGAQSGAVGSYTLNGASASMVIDRLVLATNAGSSGSFTWTAGALTVKSLGADATSTNAIIASLIGNGFGSNSSQGVSYGVATDFLFTNGFVLGTGPTGSGSLGVGAGNFTVTNAAGTATLLVGQNGLPNTYLGSVRHAERKVYYVETDWQVWWANHGGSATSISYAYVDTEGFFGHSGGMNILFCDGHVEWAPQASPILEGTSAASSRYWSPKSD